MNFFEKLAEATKSLLNIQLEIKQIREQMTEFKTDLRALDSDQSRISNEVKTVSERVTRLETLRDADKAQTAMEITRFKLDVERLIVRAANPQLLSPDSEKGT